VHDAEDRRGGGLNSAPGGFKPRSPTVVEIDPEVCASGGATEDGNCLRRHKVCVVRDRERSEGLPQLAQVGCIAGGDASARRDEVLRLKPGARLRRGAETVPITGKLVVPRVQEAL